MAGHGHVFLSSLVLLYLCPKIHPDFDIFEFQGFKNIDGHRKFTVFYFLDVQVLMLVKLAILPFGVSG